MTEVGQPLNLPGLAGTGEGKPVEVPGAPLAVQSVTEPCALETDRPQWLLVLEGELIVDLPHGDFRILRVGDALRLGAGIPVRLQPLDPVVLVRSTTP